MFARLAKKGKRRLFGFVLLSGSGDEGPEKIFEFQRMLCDSGWRSIDKGRQRGIGTAQHSEGASDVLRAHPDV
jgi:hypothetical protein